MEPSAMPSSATPGTTPPATPSSSSHPAAKPSPKPSTIVSAEPSNNTSATTPTRTAYADASSVSDDTIVEQVETTYDDAGNVLQTTTRQRFHNATGTGELTSPSGSQPKARVTYQAMYHDQIGRQIAAANYGTYGGATFDRASVVPNRTDTILVTSTEYNDAGQAYKTIDPAGREDRQLFDDAGRVVKTIQNYVDGNRASAAASDADVTVEMTYNPDGNLETLTAKNPITGDQTTTYVYGTTLSDSEIATSTLKRAEIYPDSDDTVALGDGADGIYDRIEFKYDRQQRVTQVKDQQQTVHAFDFDALGRPTQDRVTALGSGVDNAVRRIATTYDILGRREKITSYDNPSVGSGSIVNEVQSIYDDFGQLITEYQEHGGAVNTSTSLKVGYSYANGSSNTIRPTKMTYPDGRELNYNYGSSGSTDDALSRAASLIDNDGTTHLVDYSYLGRNTFVKTDYPEPDLRYDLAMGTGNDPHDGFDRFSRIVDSRWYDYGSSADVDRIKYGYDRAGNRTYREQTCDSNSNHDEVYSYDGINRLTDFDRGTINANKDAISTLKFAQAWSLDATGNWSGFKKDTDGNSTWDLDQSRTSNKVNEITDITETSGPAWVTPAYNRAGNMTIIPKPADPTQSYAATYDAWNRLVKFEEGENTLAEYLYDGAKRRVLKRTYSGGSLDETRHFYYTDPQKWQVIEERLESSGTISANPDRQFVWGLRYIDDFVLRDRDTDSNGSFDERLYSLQDANWNVTALVNSDGSVEERYAYSAYGRPRVLSPTFVVRASSDYGVDVLYAGYRHEAESGLFCIRNRWLDASLGVFTIRDSSVSGMREGLYQYSIGNPCSHTDPTGLFVDFPIRVSDAVCWPTANSVVVSSVLAGQMPFFSRQYIDRRVSTIVRSEHGRNSPICRWNITRPDIVLTVGLRPLTLSEVWEIKPKRDALAAVPQLAGYLSALNFCCVPSVPGNCGAGTYGYWVNTLNPNMCGHVLGWFCVGGVIVYEWSPSLADLLANLAVAVALLAPEVVLPTLPRYVPRMVPVGAVL